MVNQDFLFTRIENLETLFICHSRHLKCKKGKIFSVSPKDFTFMTN
jgi:hypothetical protein